MAEGRLAPEVVEVLREAEASAWSVCPSAGLSEKTSSEGICSSGCGALQVRFVESKVDASQEASESWQPGGLPREGGAYSCKGFQMTG